MRWAQFLADELRARGAKPVLTRNTDVDVPLHDRVAIGRRSGADIFVSLHANALPDGVNPATRSGTGTYFYHHLSHRAAEVLHRHLMTATGLADDGIYEANFAVIRPTAFPSVLLEAAYLMYPAEEEQLRSDKYLRRLAKGVANGLTEYFKREN